MARFSLLPHPAFHGSLSASALPFCASVLKRTAGFTSDHARSQVPLSCPQLPASPTLAQQTTLVSPFFTACITCFSAGGRLRRLSTLMQTPLSRPKGPKSATGSSWPLMSYLQKHYKSVYLLVYLIGCPNSPNLPIS